MSEVINALKRLERVGSANSRATEKLIIAARVAAAEICQQMIAAQISEIQTLITPPDREAWGLAVSYFGLSVVDNEDSCLYRFAPAKEETHTEDKAWSLWLADEVANGLIGRIADLADEKRRETEQATSTLHIGQ